MANALSYLAKAAKAAHKIDHAVSTPARLAAHGINGSIGKVVKSSFKEGRMYRKVDPKLSNGYLGVKEGPLLVAGAIAAGTLVGGTSYGIKTTFYPKTGPVNYTGSAPVLSYDGVANTLGMQGSIPAINNSMSQQNQDNSLGASGSLVFGLSRIAHR